MLINSATLFVGIVCIMVTKQSYVVIVFYVIPFIDFVSYYQVLLRVGNFALDKFVWNEGVYKKFNKRFTSTLLLEVVGFSLMNKYLQTKIGHKGRKTKGSGQ